MTIQEYSALMGYEETCGTQEYETANLAYMIAGEMDKQTFCKEWERVGGSPLVRLLSEAANGASLALRLSQQKDREAACKVLEVADYVYYECSAGEQADALDGVAVSLMGRTECIAHKIDSGYNLGRADLEYIRENLR